MRLVTLIYLFMQNSNDLLYNLNEFVILYGLSTMIILLSLFVFHMNHTVPIYYVLKKLHVPVKYFRGYSSL